MATVEIDQRWVDEIHLLGNETDLDLSTEVESALRQHLFKLRQAKIDRERQWYETHHDELAQQDMGQYIAIHNQTVVDTDGDGHVLARRSRSAWGRIPIAIILVQEQSSPPMLILHTPRLGVMKEKTP